MARINRMSTKNSNPASRFYEWKSEHQKFGYWDKEANEGSGQFVFDELPFRFLALSSYKTVTGFNSKYKGGGPKGTAVRSNEVQDLKENIRCFYFDADKTVIAEGSWNEIKDKVEAAGGKFTLSVYAMLPDGELVNIKLSGAAVGEWFDFSKNKSDMFFDHWVEVKGFKQGKTGSVVYNKPTFSFGKALTKKEEAAAEECDGKIAEYEKSYFSNEAGTDTLKNPQDSAVASYKRARDIEVTEPEVVTQESDDLDF